MGHSLRRWVVAAMLCLVGPTRAFSASLAEPPATATNATERPWAVWIQPITSLIVLAAPSPAILLTGGVNRRLTDGLDLVLEGGVVLAHQYTCGDAFGGGWAALGVAFDFPRGEHGFPLVQAKLVGQYSYARDEENGCRSGPPDTELAWGAGFDVGYRFDTGPLYLAAVIGFVVGYTNGTGDFGAGPFRALYDATPGVRPSMNPHLLRLGFAF